MDQILSILADRLGQIDWLDIVLLIASLVISVETAVLVERRTGSRLPASIVGVLTMLAVTFGSDRFGEPLLRTWLDGKDKPVIAILDTEPRPLPSQKRAPLHALLMQHHPEAREKLQRAARKIAAGDQEAVAGQVELVGIMTHYLTLYFSRTSDDAAKQFVWAATGLFQHMMGHDPQLCIETLAGRGNTPGVVGRISPAVLARLADAAGAVIADALAHPQPVPDSATIQRQRQVVVERMTSDGNPLMTNPEQLMRDGKRACFATMAIYDAISKTVPEDEIGEFLRGTFPEFLKDDEI